MKTISIIAFGIISMLSGILFLIRAVHLYKNGRKAKRILSSVQVYTIGVFISVLLVFIPIYYTSYDFGDSYTYIRPFLIAIHNSLRVFILDGDFEIITAALRDQALLLRVCFSLYVALLYVIAPILTFSNVLSLFKNIKGEARYQWHIHKKHYIMSELNAKSIALAKSIHKSEKEAIIVFTDVFEQNEEDDYELLTEAKDINAICLKKDIAHLNIFSKKGAVEVFLIGDDESENVSQAVKITNELNRKNKKHNVKIFVFSQSASGAYIIDSIKYENLLKHASAHGYDESCFKLRRINEKQQLIWNTIPQMKLFDVAERNDKTISVLIVGFGSYGLEFFKTLVWFCQFEGYKLQINIVDKQGIESCKKNRVKSLIDRLCPDLLKTNRSELVGESMYDIEIIPGIDLETADFDELLLYDGDETEKKNISNRLKKTNVTLVALGDDDLNIEVAVHLRGLFDRVNGVNAKKDMDWNSELVNICSVVYDEQKSGILYHDMGDEGGPNVLLNHKDVPYHIHFVGGMSSQFDYQNIYDSELEKSAYEHHRSWVAIEEKIYNEWLISGDQENLEKHEWYFWEEKNVEATSKAREKYEKYEYYRLSSMAKELYLREIRNNSVLTQLTACLEGNNLQTCKCDNCVRRKRSEHMRWNAYTRVMGYSYQDGVRADRAKLHDNLCEWSKLSELDRQKD